MTVRVAQLWRHRIRTHGREALPALRLTAGASAPVDKVNLP